MIITRRRALAAFATTAAAAAIPLLPARAADATTIDARVNVALGKLWQQYPSAKELAAHAKGMLVMPRVVKGGLIVGGAYGEGALRINDPASGYGPTAAYYSVSAASVGLQAGVQKTSHALFFLTDRALRKFRRADGWQVGADAEVTFPEAGMNVGVDSTSFEKPVVGFVFGEDGLLIGASLEGAKYSLIQR
jgi:lipid-binding SYLF domain-containing protein